MLSVVIPTIGRHTLVDAICSVVDEGFPVIVVGDGIEVASSIQDRFKNDNVRFYKTGRKFGCYGAMAGNLGVIMSETEFCAGLGDDDELIKGKGKVITDHITNNPEIDIWIPGIIFDDGRRWFFRKEVRYGFTPTPIIRTNVITQSPLVHPPHLKIEHAMDYMMVERAVNVYGYTIDWIEEPVYKIRPKISGDFGNGKLETQRIK